MERKKYSLLVSFFQEHFTISELMLTSNGTLFNSTESVFTYCFDNAHWNVTVL